MMLLDRGDPLVENARACEIEVPGLISQTKALGSLCRDRLLLNFTQALGFNLKELQADNIWPWVMVLAPMDVLGKATDNIKRLTDIAITVFELEDVDTASAGTEDRGDAVNLMDVVHPEGTAHRRLRI